MNRQGKLFRYNASAGSGKTHALTGFYLSRILSDPSAFRRILAVTFTNTAAAEMKGRILSRLNMLGSEPTDSTEAKAQREFIDYLCENFPDLFPGKEEAAIIVKKNAPIALKYILQDYSRFSVGTIDSFFQRVIRAFAREIDIPAGYEIELEHEILLGNAVDEILFLVATDSKLRSWISSYVVSRLDENMNWDIRKEIMEISSRIFGENFRQLDEEKRKALSDYEILQKYTEKVFSIKNGFESKLKSLAADGVRIFENNGLTVNDFLYKERGGVGEQMRRYSSGLIKEPNSYWQKAVKDFSFLSKDASPEKHAQLKKALDDGFGDITLKITSLFDGDFRLYLSAIAQVRTIHVMGILGAISEKVRTLAHDENLFLLSDSGELISKLIADDDTPFIYEKIGTTYDHYIIDEFQDTSQIQWNNFMPLIQETLSRGKDNLVVGDVKQSIYRWRNSDWRIIHSGIDRAFDPDAIKTIPLNINFRSRDNIIRFNNVVFNPESAPALCDTKLEYENLKLSSVYKDAVQKGTEEKQGGLVRVRFYDKKNEENWKDRVLMELPAIIEELQDKGYRANDILFLCRTNEEGKRIINSILEYSSGCDPVKLGKYNYEVTSGDSLYLEHNPAVTFLLSCFRYMTESGNRINLSLMVRSFALATGKDEDTFYLADNEEEIPENVFPEGWKERINEFRNSSLFIAAENLIEFFSLGNVRDNVAFINSFQDIILWYSSRYSSDIVSFLLWWENEGYKKTLAQSDLQDAMRVMTIHKAKGLQSRVVIIPFTSWDFTRSGFSKPLLWIDKVPPQFAPMPVVMPELSQQLEGSLFSEEALIERVSEWLDGLNMLYVSFTRAVDALFIMAPDDKKEEGLKATTSSLLKNVLKNGAYDAVWKDEDECRTLQIGELPPVSHHKKKNVISMSHYAVSQIRGKLRLKTGGALPLDDQKIEEQGGRAYGLMMHELLGRIRTLDDIGDAVDFVCEKGLVHNSARADLVARVMQMLSAEKVKSWFDGSCILKIEMPVILPSGVTRRPDRIMISEDEVIIVDYKFGEPRSHHTRQAAEYRDLLMQMGYKNVKAWLWYVEKDIIEEV